MVNGMRHDGPPLSGSVGADEARDAGLIRIPKGHAHRYMHGAGAFRQTAAARPLQRPAVVVVVCIIVTIHEFTARSSHKPATNDALCVHPSVRIGSDRNASTTVPMRRASQWQMISGSVQGRASGGRTRPAQPAGQGPD